MKLSTHLQFLILASMLFWQCPFVSAQKSPTPKISDRSIYTVIAFEPERDRFLFKNARTTDLDEREIALIGDYTMSTVIEHNSQNRNNRTIKDLAEYKFQYIPALFESGAKHVWVNAFCDDFDKDLKKEIIIVEDGGSCFFNFKINLETLAVYDFSVNGES